MERRKETITKILEVGKVRRTSASRKQYLADCKREKPKLNQLPRTRRKLLRAVELQESEVTGTLKTGFPLD